MHELMNKIVTALVGAILGSIAITIVFNFSNNNSSYHFDSQSSTMIKNDIFYQPEITSQPQEERVPSKYNFHTNRRITENQLQDQEDANKTYDKKDYKDYTIESSKKKADVIKEFAAHPYEQIIGLNGVSNNPNVYGAPPNSTQIEGLNGMKVYK